MDTPWPIRKQWTSLIVAHRISLHFNRTTSHTIKQSITCVFTRLNTHACEIPDKFRIPLTPTQIPGHPLEPGLPRQSDEMVSADPFQYYGPYKHGIRRGLAKSLRIHSFIFDRPFHGQADMHMFLQALLNSPCVLNEFQVRSISILLFEVTTSSTGSNSSRDLGKVGIRRNRIQSGSTALLTHLHVPLWSIQNGW
jgi:hypothetical protein